MLTALLHADAVARGWLAAPQTPGLDGIMVGLGEVGRGGAIWLAIGILLTIGRRLRLQSLWQLVLALLLAWCLNDAVLKPLVARPRPFASAPTLVRLVGSPATGSSFPSGHTAAAVAGAFMLAAYWPAGRAGLWLLAALIAYSRIYVGAHYPLDVVGGAVLGLLIAYVVIGGRDGVNLAPAPQSGGRRLPPVSAPQ